MTNFILVDIKYFDTSLNTQRDMTGLLIRSESPGGKKDINQQLIHCRSEITVNK